MTWLFFALLGPSLWALGNVLDGALRRKFIPDDLTLTWVMAAIRLPVALALLFFTHVLVAGTAPFLFLLLSGFLLTAPLWFYYKALKGEEVSRVVVMVQTVPIFNLIISHFTLNERLTWVQGGAFALLMFAGIIAAIKPSEGHRFRLSPALFLVLFASLLWAVSDVLFKAYSSSYSGYWDAFAAYLLGSSILALIALKPRGAHSPIKTIRALSSRGWIFVLISCASGTVGSVAFTYALTLGKVSLTSVMMGVQPLVALILGLAFFPIIPELTREDISKK